MNILIICTYFPPDSAIASVRPYMLAKYLSKMGHRVVVLRSGEIDQKPDDSYQWDDEDFEVLSFLGENSDAERYKRGELIERKAITYMLPGLPRKVRNILSKTKKMVKSPADTYHEIREAKRNFELQKEIIDRFDKKEFDIVFSTYADLENVFAGEYAAKYLKAKWIMDFRDSIVWYSETHKWIWNIYASHIQSEVLKKADLYTCVSDGLRQTLLQCEPRAKIVTIYNGYEASIEADGIENDNSDVLKFCYTGQFYEMRVEALELLAEGLAKLVKAGIIDEKKITFIYAGNSSAVVHQVLSRYGLANILEDHGMVSRSEAKTLQASADVFLVLSWNTIKSQGILTGKFYEGIRAEKPILSIVAGDLPNSELLVLNNAFHYGFCYEKSQKEIMEDSFLKFITDLYQGKIINGCIDYTVNPQLKEKFQYDNIARNFEKICQDLIKSE